MLQPDQNSPTEKLVVGFSDEIEKIKERLTRGTDNLDIVSIVGMGGIGKTTLAKKLYEDLNYHFHIRGWCCVSQSYDKKKLLQDILSQVTQLPVEDKEEVLNPTETKGKIEFAPKKVVKSFQDLGEMMYRSLKGRRYLIVMDDIWEIQVWNELGSFFPIDYNGSRIMFTSRMHDVVLQAKPDSPPHQLLLRSEEESWQLFQKILFHEERCPPELLDVAKEIARSCNGLPLAIVVIAGLLTRIEKDPDGWKKIAKRLSIDAQGECFHILELSYKHLPEHLKLCFLYFGAFPDTEIAVTRLIWLWIAEGFIPKIEDKSLEDIAEDCLKDLIGRSLVMVSKRRSKGGTKSCHLHDLVREFCLHKAKDEQFLQQIQQCDDLYSSGSVNDSVHLVAPHLSNPRLCVFDKRVDLRMWRPSNLSTRSLRIYFEKNYTAWSFDFSYFPGLRSLTVLDLSGVCVTQSFFIKIQLPAHLVYLSVRGEIYHIPPSILDLSKLETLLVIGVEISIAVPESIWQIATLRHLHIHGGASFKFPNHLLENSSNLGNLESLSTLWPCYAKTAMTILRALPRLRKLKCNFPEKSQSWANSGPHRRLPSGSWLYHIPDLDSLTQLESLSLEFRQPFGHRRSHSEFHLPLYLKKLVLSGFHLSVDQISIIARLPGLEVLKILSGRFVQENWKMGDDFFFALKFLKLKNLNIWEWDASNDHFPCLEQLVIESCEDLLSIPLSFEEIDTLQLIDLRWCGYSVHRSARHIEQEQKDRGNDDIKVYIYPEAQENESSS